MIRTARIACTAAPLLAILLLGARGAAAQGSLFEVETASQQKVLDLTSSAGFVVGGTFDAGEIPAQGAGVRMLWYPNKAAFRAGRVQADQWDDGKIGDWSAAFGQNTTASGTHSVALNGGATATGDRSLATGGSTLASGEFSLAGGQVSTASGFAAVALGVRTQSAGSGSLALGVETQSGGAGTLALGQRTVATGNGSMALGQESQATGANSLAGGFRAQATGNVSTAIGTGTIASGAASVAMGSAVTAGGDGSFIFGDRNVSYALTAAPNTFNIRAFGGVGINTGVAIGCDLPAGTGAWACTSSRSAKEDFADVDGEEVLGRLATIPIQRWRYLGTGAAHLGPTAEDFHAAFGLGESATKIANVDANGVALRAVQALERRTAELREENAALRSELSALRAELRALADR